MGQLCSSAMRALEAEAEVIKNLEMQSVSASEEVVPNSVDEEGGSGGIAAALPASARGSPRFQETYADLKSEAQRLGRKAHHVLHDILHVY